MYILAYILRNLEVAFLTNNLKFTYIDIFFNIILNELSKCFYSFPQGRKDCSSVIERIAKEKSQIASHLWHKSCIIIKKAILMTDISTMPPPCSSKVGTSPSSPKPPPAKDMLGQTSPPQCPAGRVFQYRVGSGRVLDKIPGSGSGSGRVGVSKYTIGYFRVSLKFSGISGYFGYFRVCRVFSGISGFTHIY